MGDNFLRQQGRNFRKRRDLGLSYNNISSLFVRPEQFQSIYKGKPLKNQAYVEGECLTAMLDNTNESVSLVRENRRIGIIDGDSARALAAILVNPESPGIIPVRVRNIASISGVAEIELVA